MIKIKNKFFKSNTLENMFLMIFLLIIYILINKFYNNNIKTFSDKLSSYYKNINFIIHLIGVFILPTPYLKRPFRIIWRLFQGGALVYLFNLCLILMMDKKTLLILLNYFDPNLPDNSPEKNYATDCRIYTPENPNSNFNNLRESVDIFMFAHFLGWMVRTFVFRSVPFVWSLSLGFEFFELTFRYWLNNFYECWWDSIFLDIFGMNLIGISIGFFVIKKFKMKKYYWFEKPKNELIEKDRSTFQKFLIFFKSGHLYEEYDFHILSNFKDYSMILYLIVFNFLFDMNLFFIKHILRIPPNHFLVIYRMVIGGFFCILLSSDFYLYIHGKKKELKTNLYLGNAIIILETLFVIIFIDINEFKKKIPIFFKICWILIFIILIYWGILSHKNSKKIKNLKLKAVKSK